MTNSLKENRIYTLDGIRGIAVLMVIAFHYINNQIPDGSWLIQRFGTPVALLSRVTYFGWSGVNLFFILSGFLIGTILLKNKHSRSFFKTFYIRRFFRIIPIYYILVTLFFLLTASPLYNPQASIFEHPISAAAFYGLIQNFYMVYYNHFGPQALTPTWSLCVEEQFYLIIPVLVYIINRKWVWLLAVFGIIIAILCRSIAANFFEGYVLLSSRIDSPMIGFLLAWLHQSQSFRNWIARNMAWVWAILGGLVIICGLIYTRTDPGIFGHTLLGLLFGLIVIIALYSRKNVFTTLLSNTFLVETGKLSYFLYLYHQLINGLLHLLLLKHLAPALDSYQAIGVTIVSLLITAFLSVVSFKFLEKPLINYSHRYKYASP